MEELKITEDDKGKLKKLYEILEKDLEELALKSNISLSELENYFIPEMKLEKSQEEGQNYLYRLASSLQNSGMMHNSIRFNEDEERRKQIKKVLCNWDSKKARKTYKSEDEIYEKFQKECGNDFDKGTGEKKETNWRKYCRGLYEGLVFLEEGNGNEIIDKLIESNNEDFEKNIKTIKDIKNKIHGLGLPLACDWLKECGCKWLAKPDVHIIEVVKYFKNIDKIKDEDVLKFMFEWSKFASCSAYKLDKTIWLLCTGNFYLNKPKTSRFDILRKIDTL